MDKDCSFCTDEVRPCRAAWGSSSHPAEGGIPPPSVGQGHQSRGSCWIQLLFWMGKVAMWISFWCGTWGGREGRPGQNCSSTGVYQKMTVHQKQCVQGMEGEIYLTQPSDSLVVTFQLVVLCENISHRTHLSAPLLLSKAHNALGTRPCFLPCVFPPFPVDLVVSVSLMLLLLPGRASRSRAVTCGRTCCALAAGRPASCTPRER